MPEHRYSQFCPLARAVEVLGGRWTMLVARELSCGPQRFSDLKRRLPGISTSVLTERLNHLEHRGLVRRRDAPPPAPVTVYEFTSRGLMMEPVLREMMRFGLLFLDPFQPGDHLEPEWVELGLAAFADNTSKPEHKIAVRIPGGTTPVEFLICGDAKGTRIEAFDAATPDVIFEAPALMVLALCAGQIDPVEIHAQGLIEVEGEPDQLRHLTALFNISELVAPDEPS